MEKPYKCTGMHAFSTDKYYIEGPGLSGYYGHKYFENPESSINKEALKKSAILMNLAYNEGIKQNQRDIRKNLGIK